MPEQAPSFVWPVLQSGAFGVLAFMVWAVVFRVFPRIMQTIDKQTEVIDKQATTFKQTLEKQEARCEAACDRKNATNATGRKPTPTRKR